MKIKCIDTVNKPMSDVMSRQVALALIAQGSSRDYSISGLFRGHVVIINFIIERVAFVVFEDNFKMHLLDSTLQKRYPQVQSNTSIQLSLFSVIVSFFFSFLFFFFFFCSIDKPESQAVRRPSQAKSKTLRCPKMNNKIIYSQTDNNNFPYIRKDYKVISWQLFLTALAIVFFFFFLGNHTFPCWVHTINPKLTFGPWYYKCDRKQYGETVNFSMELNKSFKKKKKKCFQSRNFLNVFFRIDNFQI